jgi:hypothetical protein
VFANSRGVFAIELDATGPTQNFQPVVDATDSPHFYLQDDTVFVRSPRQVTATKL